MLRGENEREASPESPAWPASAWPASEVLLEVSSAAVSTGDEEVALEEWLSFMQFASYHKWQKPVCLLFSDLVSIRLPAGTPMLYL
jgi:hypothetical protein